MASKLEVRYLPAAQEDLFSILDWIARDSQTRASAFISQLDKRIGALAGQPRMGRVPRNEKLRKIGYFSMVLEDFLVFYIIRGQTVEIHRVLHGSRNYDEIL
jgi:plasmid stabilization system protein ParE